MAKRVLVVAAHPDDEVLGAGGAIAWHRKQGDRVTVLILGEGVTARSANRGAASRSGHAPALRRLRQEMARAHRLLGVHMAVHRQFPDNRFDGVELLELVKAVEAIMRTVKPHLIYTHHQGDLNIDHRRTCEAVLAAARPLPGSTIERVLAFEVLSSTEWSLPRRGFAPTVYLSIAPFLSRKLKAMRCYRSELRPFPHPRSLRAIEAQARWRGSACGVEAAEAFVLLRERIL